MGRRQYSRDLPKGGLEVPIVLTFSGEDKDVQKAKGLIEDINAITIAKCHTGSYITKLDIAGKESKNKKQKMSNGQDSEPGLNHDGADSNSKDVDVRCDGDCVAVEDTELMTTDELEWIRVFNISLKKSEREAICNDRRFSDMHINTAQRILVN